MDLKLHLPDLEIKEDELRMLLAQKLLDEGLVSLGKAAQIAGYSERAFADMLLHRGVSPLRYENIDLDTELRNA